MMLWLRQSLRTQTSCCLGRRLRDKVNKDGIMLVESLVEKGVTPGALKIVIRPPLLRSRCYEVLVSFHEFGAIHFVPVGCRLIDRSPYG